MFDGRFDARRFGLESERMPQHQGDAQYGAAGVGDAAPRDIGRRAVDGFVEPTPTVAERGGRQHPERACEHRSFVGEDVTEQVLGEHHIEVPRAAQQMHRRRVDQHVFERDGRELVLQHPAAHLAPQPRGLEDVRLVDLCDLAATRRRETAGDAGDALDLRHRIPALIEGGRAFAPLAAEVDAARELADEQHVDAFQQLGLERRGVAQRGHHGDGPQVGVDAEFGAQTEQRGLGPDRGARPPLGSPDRTQQDGVRGEAARERVRRQAVAVRVDRRSTEGKVFERELVSAETLHSLQYTQALGHHLGADAVAAEHRDARLHAGRRAS